MCATNVLLGVSLGWEECVCDVSAVCTFTLHVTMLFLVNEQRVCTSCQIYSCYTWRMDLMTVCAVFMFIGQFWWTHICSSVCLISSKLSFSARLLKLPPIHLQRLLRFVSNSDSVVSWPCASKLTSRLKMHRKKTNSTVCTAPAEAADNLTPLCVCHSSRRRLFASGSPCWLSRPQHIGFLLPWAQTALPLPKCACVRACQVYICSPLQKVLDAAVLTHLLFQPALLSSLRLINSSIAARAWSSPLLIKLCLQPDTHFCSSLLWQTKCIFTRSHVDRRSHWHSGAVCSRTDRRLFAGPSQNKLWRKKKWHCPAKCLRSAAAACTRRMQH